MEAYPTLNQQAGKASVVELSSVVERGLVRVRDHRTNIHPRTEPDPLPGC